MPNQEFAPQPFKLADNNENQSFINAESGRLTLAPQETKQALAMAEAPAKASAQATIDKQFGGLDLFDSSAKAVNPEETSKSINNDSFDAGQAKAAGGNADNSQQINTANPEQSAAPDVDKAKGAQIENQSQSMSASSAGTGTGSGLSNGVY